ncbi:MAG: serine acetyltransferase [Clostridiales bacterium]|nr:serine acetyltransferase [Clostridiales bacterium]MCD8369422.1 serine acetyltransferase [Clostridiales bacterium]
MKRMEEEMQAVIGDIMADYEPKREINRMDEYFNQPDKEAIIDIINKLMRIMYPGYYRDKSYKIYNADNHVAMIIEDVGYRLNKQIAIALRYLPEMKVKTEAEVREVSEEITLKFLRTFPRIREYLESDLQAAYDGDPAAYYKEEVILAYPGFFAITVSRLAHELFLLKVPMIPRIMTEYAHSETGIDIHPGASIGKRFFIDHGTGIVVGETTIIGNDVKIYQGVTLGALSTRGGQKLRTVRRHPTIEDNVTIYSGASILGGETVIGHDSVIGSNVFITKSVSPGTRVSIRSQELRYQSDIHADEEVIRTDELEKDTCSYYMI